MNETGHEQRRAGCYICGQPNPVEAIFCGHCGARLPGTNIPALSQTRRTSHRAAWLAIGMAAALTLVGASYAASALLGGGQIVPAPAPNTRPNTPPPARTQTVLPTPTPPRALALTPSVASGQPSTAAPPPGPPLLPRAPRRLKPVDGTILDNGRQDRTDSIEWDFEWSPVPRATRYHLTISKPGATSATLPVVDQDTLTTPSYRYVNPGGFTALTSGWSWKVRAMVDGRWSEWSDIGVFQVEPVDTDPAR